MSIFKSFGLFRKTEPKFFNILRFLTALVFTCALGYYVWISLNKFVSEINPISLTYPKFHICPKTLSDDNNSIARISLYNLYHNRSDSHWYIIIPNNYSVNDDNKLMTKFYPNMTNNLYNNSVINGSDDNRCMEFAFRNDYIKNPKRHHKNALLFIITLDNSSIYNYFEIIFESFYITTKVTKSLSDDEQDINEVKLSQNQYFITPGRFHMCTFYFKSAKYYSTSLSGLLGFDADQDEMDIVIEDNILTQLPNTFNTVLELKYKYDFIVNDDVETFENNIIKLISSFGGFYSAISGVFILLFGASKLSPWGICQMYLLRCWPCHRSFKKHLANRYVSRAGIPLADDPCSLPEGGRIEDRVAVLEFLLKEYYIDNYYLDDLRKTHERYFKNTNTKK
ncbi:unnamed protein product [Rhizophagus irregularis]|nr:unnamed protein product [Rhizophagus irregularis]